MTAPQAVFTAAAGMVVAAVGMVIAGVALLAGAGWAFIAAGTLIGPCSVGGAVVLLRDDKARSA